jgi:MoaA/NifB/PqqE/SkfB family radical SAM enzyme
MFKIAKELLPRTFAYHLAYHGLIHPPRPMTLTFSVTNQCQSKCLTCSIWKLYREKPELKDNELKLGEIEKIFRNMSHVYFFNISGGEPFLRNDLPQIVGLALEHLTPKIIHIPTNALAPDLVERNTRAILEVMQKSKGDHIPLTIKPSLDGIREQHDLIRGVKGNFDKVVDTVKRLKVIREEHTNLHVELGTVISNANVKSISQIADFVQTLEVESYRNEIAETRSEFFNLGESITPDVNTYAKAIEAFQQRIRDGIYRQRELTTLTEALRLVYYQYAIQILKERRQVLPCLAGISNVHINPYGQVWPCCTLAYGHPMGELREVNYAFDQVWFSRQASQVREYIKKRICACPLANQTYSNILCNLGAISRVILTFARLSALRKHSHLQRNC